MCPIKSIIVLSANTLRKRIMKYLLITILSLITLSLTAHDVELRFVENRVEGDLLIVNIDMRASTYDFNLASHNIRAFYNHQSLELVDIASQLPIEQYSSPVVNELFTDGVEVNEGVLPFEDHMGFINMSVSLDDLANGGIDITTAWTTIHTATFKIKSSDDVANIVWAMENVTDVYATAFVEVGEWISAQKIVAKNVFDLRNFEQKIETAEALTSDFEVTVGPNPTTSYVTVSQPAQSAQLSIIDMTGAIIKEMNLSEGQTQIDLGAMGSGSYVFFIQSGEQTYTQQVLVAE